jgi:hypothetical protein
MMHIPVRRRAILHAGLALAMGLSVAGPAHAAGRTFVAGNVFNPDGRPAVSVWVVLHGPQREWQFLTGGDGSYFIGYVEPGQYRITVRRRDATVYSAVISLPANERYDIRLN